MRITADQRRGLVTPARAAVTSVSAPSALPPLAVVSAPALDHVEPSRFKPTPPVAHTGPKTHPQLLAFTAKIPAVLPWHVEAFALAFADHSDGLSDPERLVFRRSLFPGIPDGAILRTNLEELVTELRASSAAASATPPLSIDELLAVHSYTGFGSADTNSSQGDAATVVHRRLLVQALAKLPAFDEPVLRIHMRSSTAQYVVGEVVTEPTFFSASFGREISEMPSGIVVFDIESRTSRDISSLSCFRGENEVLFVPGTRFKVVARQEVQGTDGPLSCIRLVEEPN